MPRGRPPGSLNSHSYHHQGQGQGHQHPLLDSRRPRGKQTAYAFFVQVCRREHKRKFPDEILNFAELAKKTASRWKIMSEKEKRRFNIMADEDKRRYELEMANYNAVIANQEHQQLMGNSGSGAPNSLHHNNGHAPYGHALENGDGKRKRQRRMRKRVKDPNAPKRCMSAFFWYSQDERPKVKAANPDFAVGEIAKELGRRWSEANDAARAKYEALAEKDRARYDVAKKAYQKSLLESGQVPTQAAFKTQVQKKNVVTPSVITPAPTSSGSGSKSSSSSKAKKALAEEVDSDEDDVDVAALEDELDEEFEDEDEDELEEELPDDDDLDDDLDEDDLE